MKKAFLQFVLILSIAIFAFSCSSDSSSSPSSGNKWNFVALMNMGGEYPITGTATITFSGTEATCNITTDMVAGATEVHNIVIKGVSPDGKNIGFTNVSFSTDLPGDQTEQITNGTGVLVINGNSLNGSGTFKALINGTINVDGSLSVTGTKQ